MEGHCFVEYSLLLSRICTKVTLLCLGDNTCVVPGIYENIILFAICRSRGSHGWIHWDCLRFLTQQLKVNFYLFWKFRISKLSNLEDFSLSTYSLDIFNAAFFKLHYSIALGLWPGNNRRDYANLLKYMLGTSHCKETREHNFVFREEESRESE